MSVCKEHFGREILLCSKRFTAEKIEIPKGWYYYRDKHSFTIIPTPKE
jgi:hypothetical protein